MGGAANIALRSGLSPVNYQSEMAVTHGGKEQVRNTSKRAVRVLELKAEQLDGRACIPVPAFFNL